MTERTILSDGNSELIKLIDNFVESSEQMLIFDSVNRDNRIIIHQYCQRFNLYTKSIIISEVNNKKMIISKELIFEEEDRLDIVEFCNFHYNQALSKGKLPKNAIADLHKIFMEKKYDIKPIKCNNFHMFLIYYQEWNKLWHPLWARQTRGTVMFLNEKTNMLEPLRYSLERNTEILTGKQIKKVDNESLDVDILELECDKQQKFIKNKISNPDTIYENAYVSGKTDGMLCTINVYRENYKSIGKELNETVGLLGKIINELCEDLDFIFTISSQKKFIITDDKMYRDILTSLLCGTHIISFNDLKDEVSKPENRSINYIFKKYLPKFVDKISNFIKQNGNSCSRITLNFEMVLPKFMNAWQEKSSSLALVYNVPLFRLLGVSYINNNNKLLFLPHFEFKQAIFDEPYVWKVNSQHQLEKMLEMCSNIIRKHNNLTVKSFIDEFIPINYNDGEIAPFDFEGFIFYVELPIDLQINHKKYEASKVKTEEYYKMHKIRIQDLLYVKEILEISPELFPEAKVAFERLSKELPIFQDFCNKFQNFIQKIIDTNNELINTFTYIYKQDFLTPFEIGRKINANEKNKIICIWNDLYSQKIQSENSTQNEFIGSIIKILRLNIDKKTNIFRNDNLELFIENQKNRIYGLIKKFI